MKNAIELPNLPVGYEIAAGETLSIEVSGATLHLLKWLVADKRSNCESLASAVDECIEQGFKYHKRLADAEVVRKQDKARGLAQAQFERWCELNPKKAADAIERGYMMAQYGLLDSAIAEVFKSQMSARLAEQAKNAAKPTTGEAKKAA